MMKVSNSEACGVYWMQSPNKEVGFEWNSIPKW